MLGTPPEPDYDHIARLAADLFQAPLALVNLIAGDRAFWKARVGTGSLSGGPREHAFCAHAILDDAVMVLPDTARDPRFAQNPYVAGAPGIRFYAGAPLVAPSGHRLGTLCVLDLRPRPALTPQQERLLQDLATLVMDRLELRRLGKVQQFAARMAATTADGIVCADGSGTITFWNKAAEKLFGYTRREAVGQSLALIVPERLRAGHDAGLARVRDGAAPRLVGKPVELQARRKDGSELPVELSLAVWRDGQDFTAGAIIRDVSERRRAEERLKHLALYDQLTGLPNRILFQDRLAEAAAAGEGAASQLLLDLDGFKDVNDSLGHRAGDALLKAVAERLREAVGPDDTVARLGGDEYAILLPGCGDPRRAEATALRVLESFGDPFDIEGRLVHVGTSIGIALCPGLCSDPEEMMASADLALYRAKEEGGGRCAFYHAGLRQQVTARRSLEEEIRRGFANGEFELHYQPQVRLGDGLLVGAEALLRWRHPRRGLLAPGAFLPVLETSSLAEAVGDWTIEVGCAFAASLLRAGLPPIRIGINLFAAQFRSGALVGTVAGALEASGLPSDRLELEITENIVLGHDDSAVAPLRELRARGVGLAFDDYGTGYASLSLLKRYPLTRLKIDREFVRDLATDPDDAAIVKAVLALGRSLNLDVIAEGIETPDQAAFLGAHGCAEAQGYYYGKPMAGSEFARLLAGGGAVREAGQAG